MHFVLHLPVMNVQARLDRQSEEALNRLMRRLGRSPSEIVREGIKLLDACNSARPVSQRIIGLGEFSSDVRDLGSNKKHLKNFGR